MVTSLIGFGHLSVVTYYNSKRSEGGAAAGSDRGEDLDDGVNNGEGTTNMRLCSGNIRLKLFITARDTKLQ